MSISFHSVRNGCIDLFYINGLNLAKVYFLREEMKQMMDFPQEGQLDQALECTQLNKRNYDDSSVWLTAESFIIDWCDSYAYDPAILEQCLDAVEIKDVEITLNSTQLKDTIYDGLRQDIYKKYPKESQLVIRVLYRKKHEEQLKNPGLSTKELFTTSLTALKAALEKDKEVRRTNKTARLDSFTACPSVQTKLMKKSAKTAAIYVAASIGMIFFSTLKTAFSGENNPLVEEYCRLYPNTLYPDPIDTTQYVIQNTSLYFRS